MLGSPEGAENVARLMDGSRDPGDGLCPGSQGSRIPDVVDGPLVGAFSPLTPER